MTQQTLDDEHRSSLQLPKDIDDDDTSRITTHPVDRDARIEVLERNFRYIQQQHEITLTDLHQEIHRLQQENRDLHYRLNDTQASPSAEPKPKHTDEPIHENHVDLEQKIDELEKQLIESEEKNIYLIQKLDELNKISLLKSEESNTNKLNTDNDYQHLLVTSNEKEQQHLQEVAKLRSGLVEVLNTERLSLPSRILLRDCLTSINISELSMSKTTTTPTDTLFFHDKQRRRFDGSPSLTAKTSSFRQSHSQHRSVDQRVNLPLITQENSSPLSQHSIDLNGVLYYSLSPPTHSQHQRLIKVGETPVARRERRTQELQRNRLMKNLFH